MTTSLRPLPPLAHHQLLAQAHITSIEISVSSRQYPLSKHSGLPKMIVGYDSYRPLFGASVINHSYRQATPNIVWLDFISPENDYLAN